MSADRTFRSKIDAWLVALVGGAAILPLVAGLWLLALGQVRGVLLLTAWGLITSLLLVVLSFPLRYTLQADRLHIQSGRLDWDVPYRSLGRVAPSRNPLSAPAWSLDRLRLDYAGGGFILISPADRGAFLQELAARCAHLALSGEVLIIAPARPHEKKPD